MVFNDLVHLKNTVLTAPLKLVICYKLIFNNIVVLQYTQPASL